MNPVQTNPAPPPPAVKGYPLIGDVPDYARDPLGHFERLHQRYGDVSQSSILGKPHCFVFHPDLIEEVHLHSQKRFIKGYNESFTFRSTFGNGLLSSNGDFWLRQRRLAQPAFHRERIAGYSHTMTQYTLRMLQDWHDGQTLDAHQAMMQLTLEIVCKTLFDAEAGPDAKAIGQAFEVVLHQFDREQRLLWPALLPAWLPNPSRQRLRRAVQAMEQAIARFIETHRGQDKGDLLSMLMAAQDTDGSQMTAQQLRDECMNLLLAGHETTANTLSWTLWLLSQHPQVQQTLEQELDGVLQGRTPTLADLPQLRYTDQVIKESMRLRPPVWVVSRIAAQETELGGYRIAQGTEVIMSQWVTHRDPRFFAEPLAFRPQRWTPEMEKALPRYAYFPFGGGPRQCIGNQFAQMEAVLVLATIAQRYRWKSLQNAVPEASLTLRPKGGLPLQLSKR